jgi:hypothetical protein
VRVRDARWAALLGDPAAREALDRLAALLSRAADAAAAGPGARHLNRLRRARPPPRRQSWIISLPEPAPPQLQPLQPSLRPLGAPAPAGDDAVCSAANTIPGRGDERRPASSSHHFTCTALPSLADSSSLSSLTPPPHTHTYPTCHSLNPFAPPALPHLVMNSSLSYPPSRSPAWTSSTPSLSPSRPSSSATAPPGPQTLAALSRAMIGARARLRLKCHTQ